MLGLVAASAQGGTLYRLNKDSTFQQGCFPPCLCPITIPVPVKGTFVLTPTGFDGLYDTYAVADVNWLVSMGGTNATVTGSGTYKVGGEFALQQQLALDLQIGGDKAQHFDSGLMTGPAPFPDIQVTISMNGQVCFDKVFDVSASPVPPDQIQPYRLLEGSTFQRGCFGACNCALGPIDQMIGTFDLVPLDTTPLSREFAVVNARWKALEPATPIPVGGYGTYTVSGEFAVQNRLRMFLSVDNQVPVQFDSGWVAGGGTFPDIDTRISISGAICFDTVMNIHAAPAAQALQMSSALVSANSGFQFNVTATNLNNYVIEASSTLTNWIALATNSLATWRFVDTNATHFGHRFYRVRQLP